MNESIRLIEGQPKEKQAWSEDFLKNVPEFTGEKKFVRLEEIANLCDFSNSMVSGHGTASAGNGHEVVENIFKEGVKGFESLGSMIGENRADKVVGSTDLMDNTIWLWSSSEGDIDFAKMREKLDNWPHRKAENVILMRFPLDYYHMYTEIPDERTRAYFTEHEDANGQPTNYIDRRLIIGNYNTKTGIVELNPYFEAEISEEFKKELDARFKETKKLAEERQRRNADSPFGFINNQTGGSEAVEEDESAEEVDWDDSDWD